MSGGVRMSSGISRKFWIAKAQAPMTQERLPNLDKTIFRYWLTDDTKLLSIFSTAFGYIVKISLVNTNISGLNRLMILLMLIDKLLIKSSISCIVVGSSLSINCFTSL